MQAAEKARLNGIRTSDDQQMNMSNTQTRRDTATRGVAAEADRRFLDGGYARLHYLNSAAWLHHYRELEILSEQFVALAWEAGNHGYEWPLDPLHWWSRTWEYPWIAAQLERLRDRLRGPRVLDVGAAVTFFTLFLEKQGFEVTNMDRDPAMPLHFARVFERVRGERLIDNVPRYIVGDARDTGIAAASFDLILCVSVLEHIPGWEKTLPEISRLLAPGGHLILTFDVRRNTDSDGLSVEDASRLLDTLQEWFIPETKEEKCIPADAICTVNAPLQTRLSPSNSAQPSRSLMDRMLPLSKLSTKVFRRIKRTLPREPENICIYGGVWRKR